MGKPELYFKEPDRGTIWLQTFEARARVLTKKDIDAAQGTSGPSAVAAVANDYQLTDFLTSQCGLEALIKLSGLVAPRHNEGVNFLKPQERLVVAERFGFLKMSQGGEEAETNYLARL